MASTVIAFIVGILLLLMAARYVAVVALTGKERFRVGHPLGLRSRELTASEEAWDAGHRAARPILLVTIVMAFLDAFLTVVMFQEMSVVATIIVGVIEVALILALAAVARSQAVRQARLVTPTP
ncbi:MAG: hypothetical protein E7A62_09735 [Actinomycetaceae bacterium]|nr:hypothetical protein [Actinomycetaceae bacterium]MDU0971249.1 hypothetical protein [Actinomycetaceae bacterium]